MCLTSIANPTTPTVNLIRRHAARMHAGCCTHPRGTRETRSAAPTLLVLLPSVVPLPPSNENSSRSRALKRQKE